MTDNAAENMKARMRADLTAAMKSGRKADVAVLRELIATLDNAEAAPGREERASLTRHEFGKGTAETERLALSGQQVRDLLQREIETRERATAEFDRLGRSENAETLRAQADIARRYVEPD